MFLYVLIVGIWIPNMVGVTYCIFRVLCSHMIYFYSVSGVYVMGCPAFGIDFLLALGQTDPSRPFILRTRPGVCIHERSFMLGSCSNSLSARVSV